MTPPNAEIVSVLQTAIGPVILISGAGLLLLTMTNRLGRTIDRAREFAALPATARSVVRQLPILWLRARLLRLAILLVSLSLLCVALLIIALFLSALLKLDLGGLIAGLFMGGMGLLIASLVAFLHDVNQSLAALKLEVEEKGIRT